MKDGRHVILCVDDDPDILQTLRMLLDRHGYLMVEAGGAEEALRRYREVEPDLLIVDLMMERVDSGADLLRSIAALGNTAPMFLLSSVGDELNRTLDAAELGLAGVFQKPIDPTFLLDTLRTKLTAG